MGELSNTQPKEYILLANAHATQHTDNGVKTDWSIEANQTNEQLGTLPRIMNEAQVFEILDFARKYELTAFNEGIILGKEKQLESSNTRIEHLEEQLRYATEENERLATALDNLHPK